MATLFILFTGLAAAVVTDVRTRRIPNWLTGAIAGAGFGLACGGGTVTPLQAALGLLAGLLLMMPGHVIGATGAGDVKLMAAVGAIVGLWNWIGILVLTSIFGGVAAIVLVSKTGRVRSTFRNIWTILRSLTHRQAPYESNPELDVRNEQAVRLPHAVTIAFGAMGFLIAAYVWAPR